MLNILDRIPLHGEGVGKINIITLLGGSDLESWWKSVVVLLHNKGFGR
jgi:hypothetical protein